MSELIDKKLESIPEEALDGVNGGHDALIGLSSLCVAGKEAAFNLKHSSKADGLPDWSPVAVRAAKTPDLPHFEISPKI